MGLNFNGNKISLGRSLIFQRTLTSNDDMNTIFKEGIYETTNSAPKNSPLENNEGRWGTIFVIQHDTEQIIQLWLIQNSIYHRWITVTGPQTNWSRYADKSDIDNLQSQINVLKNKIGGGN